MALSRLEKRPHEAVLRLSAQQLARLQGWVSSAAREYLVKEVLSVGDERVVSAASSDRRTRLRRRLETTATVRLISPGGAGACKEASVVDVSRDGIALRVAEPMDSGKSVSLQINPPGVPRPPATLPGKEAEEPIFILAVVRYCRPEDGSYILGCSFGAEWAATLAGELFPADLLLLRKSA